VSSIMRERVATEDQSPEHPSKASINRLPCYSAEPSWELNTESSTWRVAAHSSTSRVSQVWLAVMAHTPIPPPSLESSG
jgi:hypothetical protein